MSALVIQPACNAVAGRFQERLAKHGELAFLVPVEDYGEFMQTVKAEERARVKNLLHILDDIHRCPKITEACLYHSARLGREGQGRGWSADRLRTLYYAYLRSKGDWRVLVNQARNRAAGLRTRPLFLKFWRMLCDRHQRCVSSAFRELRDIFETRFDDARKLYKVIPGYDTWPEPEPDTGLPAGWTEANLRRFAPDSFERKAARVGVMAASQLGLKARFSRAGLKPYEQVSFDDHEYNVKVLYPGMTRTLRPRCFGAHDVCSDDLISVITKHTYWDEAEEKKKVLSETDFLWFAVAYLTEIGYREDTGTKFLLEHGTSTLRGDNIKPERPIDHPDRTDPRARIWRATGGKVTIDRSGRFHKPAHGGQFAAPSGGNFRFKPIERMWRMIDDRLDSLPAQVGKDRDHCPEAMEREERYVTGLLKDAPRLDDERAKALIFPWLTFTEFCEHITRVTCGIGDEREHDIAQWEKCGFVMKEFRESVNHPWRPLAELPEAMRELGEARARELAEALQRDDQLTRARRMTRREARLTMPLSALRRVPRSAIPDLVGKHNALRGGEPLTVRNGEFTFEDWRISPDELAYLAVDAAGNRLNEGTRCVCYVNPCAPGFLIACDMEGRVIAECPLREPANRADEQAVVKQAGAVMQWRDRALGEMRKRNEDGAARVEFIKAHNEAVRNARAPKPVRSTAEGRAAADEILTMEESEPIAEDTAANELLEAL